MQYLKKIWNVIKKPKRVFFALQSRNIFNWMPDKMYLQMVYYLRLGEKLNLKNPRGFNEKIQWLKLNDHQENYIPLVDKYEVKSYVKNVIGEEYIIPTLGVWENFDDIDFDKLPQQFVLKCTHDSGGVVICKDIEKFDKTEARNKIRRALKRNFFYMGREWPYKNVTPRIIAEKYMEDENEELKDYKLMCFNGKVKCSFVCSDRFSKEGLHVTFFDKEWNVMPFERHYPAKKQGIEKPETYEKMIELAEKLSKGIPFVRVDFYEIKGQIYFGELTFYPGSGMEEFTPKEWDYILGDWICLPTACEK